MNHIVGTSTLHVVDVVVVVVAVDVVVAVVGDDVVVEVESVSP